MTIQVTNPGATLDDAEQQRRAELVRAAREAIESSGGCTPEEDRAGQDAWVRGETTLDELIERVQHRLVGPPL